MGLEINDWVEYDVAKLLNNKLYGDNKYAAEDLEVTFDNYLGVTKYKEGDFIDDGDNIHGKYYYAPLYGEVIQWFFEKNDAIIELRPAFTMALEDRTAFYPRVWKINHDECKLNLLWEDNDYMYSFKLAIKTILEKILENGK